MSRIARILTLVTAMLLSLPVAAGADPNPPVSTFTYTNNMEPLGAALHPLPASGQFNSDIAFWGDRAIQGTYWGFQIIDISNPEDPQTITDYDQCRGNQGDVIIWENILIRSWNSPAAPTGTPPVLPTCDGDAVQLGFEGLHIFDITNPLNPDLIASVNIPGCGSHTATGVPDLTNNRLLVYNNPSAAGQCMGFDIISIPLNNPAAPTNLGRFNTGRSCHDTAVILGDAMLASCAGGNGLSVFSIGGAGGGTLTVPKMLWSKSLAADSVTIGHATSFSWDGEIVLFGHEPGGGGAAECEATDVDSKKTTFFFNAADGTELGRHVLPRPQTAQENCTIHNFNTVPLSGKRIAVQGNYQSGIAVIDFTDPTKPKEIAYADPAPLNPDALVLGGDWSTHWYDGEIYESDITRGVITWRLNDPAVAGAQTLGHLNPQTQEFTIPFTGQPGADVLCKGKAVTIPGTDGNDVLKGTAGVDVMIGGNGNDKLFGKKGNDVICGGKGNDVLRGGAGNDILLGGPGKDIGKGGAGTKDLFKGGPGKDKGAGFEEGKP